MNEYHISNYISFSVNGVLSSLHRNITEQISIFAALNDCDESNSLEIKYDISEANVTRMIKCLNDEDYKCDVDVPTFIAIFRFAVYVGLNERLMQRVTSKLVRTDTELSEFIEHFSKSDDPATTYEIFCHYELSIQPNETQKLWKIMIGTFTGNVLVHVLMQNLEAFGYDVLRYSLKYIDSTTRHYVPFIHNIVDSVYGPDGCKNCADRLYVAECGIPIREMGQPPHLADVDALLNYHSYSMCETSSEYIFFADAQEICREKRGNRPPDVMKTICSYIVSQLPVGHKFSGIYYK